MKKKRSILVKQLDITDCGAACLSSISAYYGHHRSVSLIRSEAGTDKNGTSLLGLVKAAEKIGFQSSAVKIEDKKLIKEDLPAIAHLKIKEVWFHFVVIYSLNEHTVTIMDPAKGKLERISMAEFKKNWTGILLLLKPGERFTKTEASINPHKRIISIIKPHRKSLFKVMAGAIFYSAAGITTAIYIEKLADTIIPSENTNQLHLFSLSLLFIFSLKILVGFLKNHLLLKTGRMIDSGLIQGFNHHVLHLPFHFFQSMKSGEILTRISDAIKIRSFINSMVQEISVNSLIVCITVTMMFLYSTILGLTVLISIPLYLLLYQFLNNTNKKYLKKTMEFGAELESNMVETVKGIKTIKAFNMERATENKLESSSTKLLNSIFKTSKDYLITSSGAEFISSLFLLVILWLGSYQVITQKISYGELFSFYSLYSYMSSPLIHLILSNRGIQDAKIAADRLFQIMDLEKEKNNLMKKNWQKKDRVNIKLKNISFAYPGKQELFRNMTFECHTGTMNAIVGESGSGKSSLISLILNFYLPEKGDIFYNNEVHHHLSPNHIRSFSSYVPQEVRLFFGTLGENISLEKKWNPQKIEKSIKKAGLTDLINKLPQGIHTFISEDGNNISGGERQKVALARAIYKNAPLLLLDEPSSNMDTRSEQNLLMLLDELKKEGKTIIIAAHNLSIIQKAEQILVLQEGNIIESGSHTELLAKDTKYREMWHSQKQEKIFRH